MSLPLESESPEAKSPTSRQPPAVPASPPLPPAQRVTVRKPSAGPADTEYEPLRGILGPGAIIDAVLRTPGRLAYELAEGRQAPIACRLLQLTAGFLLLSGFAMGSFAGGAQLWKVPLKVSAGAFFAALICLPSLHIFTSLSGARQTFAQTASLLLAGLCLCSLLLAGFAPIVWVFSQSTGTTVFMGVLHLAFWGVGVAFGLRLLRRSLELVNRAAIRGIGLWAVVFMAVVMQLSTTLRPLIGRDDGQWTKPKQSFLQHWGDCMRDPKP